MSSFYYKFYRGVKWIKNNVFFQYEMSVSEFIKYIGLCVLVTPLVIALIYMIFALGYMIQGYSGYMPW